MFVFAFYSFLFIPFFPMFYEKSTCCFSHCGGASLLRAGWGDQNSSVFYLRFRLLASCFAATGSCGHGAEKHRQTLTPCLGIIPVARVQGKLFDVAVSQTSQDAPVLEGV